MPRTIGVGKKFYKLQTKANLCIFETRCNLNGSAKIVRLDNVAPDRTRGQCETCTLRHHIAMVDIARLVLICDYLHTTFFSTCHVAGKMRAKSLKNLSTITGQKFLTSTWCTYLGVKSKCFVTKMSAKQRQITKKNALNVFIVLADSYDIKFDAV